MKRALISVYDKTGILEFAKFLVEKGIEIISTPGHMPGHISIYHKESKSLIAGDALVVENGELVIALPQYTLDIEGAKRSIKKFLDYDIDRIICYHGGVYEKDIVKTLENI